MENAKKQNTTNQFNFLQALDPIRETFEDTYTFLEAVEVFGNLLSQQLAELVWWEESALIAIA